MNSSEIHQTTIPSPLGPLLVGASTLGLVGIYFLNHCPKRPADTDTWLKNESRFESVKLQLEEYFSGKRRTFDLPLDLKKSGTPFFHSVWKELLKIPYGQTISYRELAERLGKPTASRAVGMANSRNPISIIVPCHRVISQNGKLTGYAGGLDNKHALLSLEKK